MKQNYCSECGNEVKETDIDIIGWVSYHLVLLFGKMKKMIKLLTKAFLGIVAVIVLPSVSVLWYLYERAHEEDSCKDMRCNDDRLETVGSAGLVVLIFSIIILTGCHKLINFSGGYRERYIHYVIISFLIPMAFAVPIYILSKAEEYEEKRMSR